MPRPRSLAALVRHKAALVRFRGRTGRLCLASTVITMLAAAAAREPVSVKDFGARGDGVTDDTSAIAKAILAARTRGTLIFPSGTYLVSPTGGEVCGGGVAFGVPPDLTLEGHDATIKTKKHSSVCHEATTQRLRALRLMV